MAANQKVVCLEWDGHSLDDLGCCPASALRLDHEQRLHAAVDGSEPAMISNDEGRIFFRIVASSIPHRDLPGHSSWREYDKPFESDDMFIQCLRHKCTIKRDGVTLKLLVDASTKISAVRMFSDSGVGFEDMMLNLTQHLVQKACVYFPTDRVFLKHGHKAAGVLTEMMRSGCINEESVFSLGIEKDVDRTKAVKHLLESQLVVQKTNEAKELYLSQQGICCMEPHIGVLGDILFFASRAGVSSSDMTTLELSLALHSQGWTDKMLRVGERCPPPPQGWQPASLVQTPQADQAELFKVPVVVQ